MAKRRDYITPLKDYKVEESLAKQFAENGANVVGFYGASFDEYAINTNGIDWQIGNIKARQYVLLFEKYLNDWASVPYMLATDSARKYNIFCECRNENRID